MQILISGGSGFRNTGDEALLRASVQFCKRSFPDARLVHFANNPAVARSTLQGLDVELAPSPRVAFFRDDEHYYRADDVFRGRWHVLRSTLVGKPLDVALDAMERNPHLHFADRWAGQEILRIIDTSDVFLVHGGGVLTSATRSRLWELCLLAEIAHGLDTPVFFRSHQLGPYDEVGDLACAKAIGKLARLISTRDMDQSRLELLRVAPKAHVIDQVDDALLLETADSPDFLAEHGLEPGRYICVGYRDNPGVGVSQNAFERTALIVHEARSRLGLPVVLLPQGPFDEPSLERLAGLCDFDTKLIRAGETLDETIAVASKARLMIACPHHSLIFALRGGVPVLSPTMGDYYLFKNTGSLRHFGLEDFVVDIAQEPSVFMPKVRRCIDELMGDGFRDALHDRVVTATGVAQQQDLQYAHNIRSALDSNGSKIRKTMRFYHFTTLERLEAAKRDGLRFGYVQTSLLEGHEAVWLTTDGEQEIHTLSADQIFTPEELHLTNGQRSKPEVRITLELPASGLLHRWLDFGSKYIERPLFEGLNSKAPAHQNWWLYFGVIPPQHFAEVRILSAARTNAGH